MSEKIPKPQDYTVLYGRFLCSNFAPHIGCSKKIYHLKPELRYKFNDNYYWLCESCFNKLISHKTKIKVMLV